MPASVSADMSQEFDVRSINLKLYSTRRPGRYLGLGVAVGITIIGVIVTTLRFGPIVAGVESLSQLGLVYLVVMVLALATVLMLGSLYFTFSPGADSLKVMPSAIEMTYTGGRTKLLRWSSAHLRFKLLDFSDRGMAMMEYGSNYFLEIPGGQWTAIPFVAFRSVLAASKEKGLEVATFRGFAGYGIAPTVHYVHPPGTRILRWMRSPVRTD